MDDRFERGQKIREEVLGAEFVTRMAKRRDSFMEPMQRLSTEHVWTDIWSRDGLSRHSRSIANLGMLAALGRQTELKTHVRAAINNGCSVEEIQEVLLQAAVYCGIPAGVDAFRSAREVLLEMKLLEPVE
jgi:4-carboxymuconolactone decarboxylase